MTKHTLLRFRARLLSLIFVAPIIFTGATAYAAGPAAVNLGTAGNYVILTKTGISTTGTTRITGDIGVSPIAATAMTGFGLIADATNVFSTSALITGKAYAATYADPTPANLTTAIGDMQTAYTDAAGRTLPTATELGAGDISGLTITPGLYKWGTGVSVNSDVTLSGGPNDIWIFQVAQGLTVASGKKIILSGGAQAKNIFWQVASTVDIGTTAQFNGNILAQTAIILHTGATLTGRALAQTAVTLDSNAVTTPGNASVVVTPTPTPTPAPVTPAPTPAPVYTPAPVTSSGSTSGTGTVSSGGSGTSMTTSAQTSSSASGNASVVAMLQTQLNGVLAQIAALPSNASVNANASFSRDLKFGSSGEDVRALQMYLNTHGYVVATNGAAGSAGNETSAFGPATRAAVVKLQIAAGISPAVGYFGAKTRGYIAAHQ